jgi:hypothetical protein
MACEAVAIHHRSGDARRLLFARLVLAHRLSQHDPYAVDDPAWFEEVATLLLSDQPVPLQRAVELAICSPRR